MRWPWNRTEKRQQSGGAYSDAIVAAIVAQASGNSVGEPGAIAALETSAGLWARAFASAELSPAIPAVTPSVLASVGRELVRRGESLWAIDVRRGQIELRAAGSWDIAGGPHPETWQYRLDLFGPSGSETRIYPAAAVLHFKFAADPERPWHGISPLGFARQTGRLAANLELRLAEEAGARVGYLLPIPADGGTGDAEDPLAALKTDLAGLCGNTALVETTSGGFAEGRAAAPQSDWAVRRLGANPPQTLAALRGDAAMAVAAACGVPPGLTTDKAEGTSQRESWRRFCFGTVQPVARCVAEELSAKLDAPGLRLNFDRLFASDLAGRSRSVGILVKAGMNLERAAKLAGLEG